MEYSIWFLFCITSTSRAKGFPIPSSKWVNGLGSCMDSVDIKESKKLGGLGVVQMKEIREISLV